MADASGGVEAVAAPDDGEVVDGVVVTGAGEAEGEDRGAADRAEVVVRVAVALGGGVVRTAGVGWVAAGAGVDAAPGTACSGAGCTTCRSAIGGGNWLGAVEAEGFWLVA